MTSRGIIMTVCWAVVMVDLFTETWAADPFTPMAFIVAFLIMEFTGMFKKELANAAGTAPEKDERSQRQIDFIRKLEEGRKLADSFDPESEELQAKVIMLGEDGTESSIIIKPDGTVETEGNPDPDVIEAVKMLRQTVIDHGPEAVAEELGKQIDKIKREKH